MSEVNSTIDRAFRQLRVSRALHAYALAMVPPLGSWILVYSSTVDASQVSEFELGAALFGPALITFGPFFAYYFLVSRYPLNPVVRLIPDRETRTKVRARIRRDGEYRAYLWFATFVFFTGSGILAMMFTPEPIKHWWLLVIAIATGLAALVLAFVGQQYSYNPWSDPDVLALRDAED